MKTLKLSHHVFFNLFTDLKCCVMVNILGLAVRALLEVQKGEEAALVALKHKHFVCFVLLLEGVQVRQNFGL